MSLAEVENMAALPFTLGGSGCMLPQEILVILGVLSCILRQHTYIPFSTLKKLAKQVLLEQSRRGKECVFFFHVWQHWCL